MADIPHPYFNLYKDARGEWRWNIKARNHKIIADSAEGYTSKQGAINGINLVKGVTSVWDSETQTWINT
jgi:uncharacterized protein YegP (UPF0339 family)